VTAGFSGGLVVARYLVSVANTQARLANKHAGEDSERELSPGVRERFPHPSLDNELRIGVSVEVLLIGGELWDFYPTDLTPFAVSRSAGAHGFLSEPWEKQR
jgi:hypothetical protein